MVEKKIQPTAQEIRGRGKQYTEEPKENPNYNKKEKVRKISFPAITALVPKFFLPAMVHRLGLFPKKITIEFIGTQKVLVRLDDAPVFTMLHDPKGMQFFNVRGLFNLFRYTYDYTENSPYASRYELHTSLGIFDFGRRK